MGDNPFSDIQGANAYGFSSILVRTGVFRGKDNHAEHPATTVQADVLVSAGVCQLMLILTYFNSQDAVKWALRKELGSDVI